MSTTDTRMWLLSLNQGGKKEKGSEVAKKGDEKASMEKWSRERSKGWGVE